GDFVPSGSLGFMNFPPVEGARVRFGRSPQPDVEIPIGEDDREVSRQHGLLVHRQGWWWLSNLGRLALEVSGTHRLNSADDPVPLSPGYTSVLISSRTRRHLLELHVVEHDHRRSRFWSSVWATDGGSGAGSPVVDCR
ncbi:FHA domain-containing protein, partial [Kibdelosporangium lantanae]